MKPANIVTLTTGDELLLDAVLFGSPKAKTGLIFMHGLSSSAFSHNDILPGNDDCLSLYIHNRGHDELTSIKHLAPDTEKGYDWSPGGKAHEIFTDCVHDIQAGIDYLKGLGVNKIFLAGHSTGCQKSIYYLAQSDKYDDINGAILVCPMSDYASARHDEDPKKLAAAVSWAKQMVRQGKSDTLMPEDIWQETIDAQRFLSLYTPDSAEEIFTYSQPGKKPELLQKVGVPLLVLIAERDEYADRPTEQIALWFEENANHASVKLIPGSLHGLTGKGEEISGTITAWLSTVL